MAWLVSPERPTFAGVEDADIVVEAAFEKVEIKTEIFAALDEICKPGAVLATNTSAIPVTTIAAATSRPESVGNPLLSPRCR